jgi:hypothetical protein
MAYSAFSGFGFFFKYASARTIAQRPSSRVDSKIARRAIKT